jgi:hypothetical protein
MFNEEKKTIALSEFLSVLGNEFMLSTGHGIYAFFSYQSLYKLYEQYATAEIPVESFAKKLAKKYHFS